MKKYNQTWVTHIHPPPPAYRIWAVTQIHSPQPEASSNQQNKDKVVQIYFFCDKTITEANKMYANDIEYNVFTTRWSVHK